MDRSLPFATPRLTSFLIEAEPSAQALRFFSSIDQAPECLSFSELIGQIQAAKATFKAFGIGPGDCVAMLCANEPEVLIHLFALNELGACLLPMNFRLAPAEWRAVIDDAGACLVLVADEFAKSWSALNHLRPFVSLETWRAPGVANLKLQRNPLESAERAALDVALMVYTSGTTGKPKGVLHATRNLIANAKASWAAHDFTEQDRVLCPLPLFHVGGLCIQTLPALLKGLRVSLLKRFEPALYLQVAQSDAATVTLVVPAVMRALLDHPKWSSTDLSALRLCMAGSSIVPPELIEAFHARGLTCGQMYGSTETGPVSLVLGLAQARARVGSVGWPCEGVRAKLVMEDGVGDGVGEIWLKAENLALGYWKALDHPAFAQGWFRTGDLASQDEQGAFWVVGRSKDMIISGGENIYPAELEMLVVKFPEVRDCAAVGVPDPHWGEALCLVVELAPGAQLSLQTICARLAGKLAKFKWPKQLRVVESFPRTALGKIQKSVLQSQLNDRN